MQLRAKITFVYTLVAVLILLSFSIAIYVFSYQNRKAQFKDRLVNKAASTGVLINTKLLSLDKLVEYNSTSPTSLVQRSLLVLDGTGKQIFKFNDPGAVSIDANRTLVQLIEQNEVYSYADYDRDVVGMVYKAGNTKLIVIVAAFDDTRAEWLSKLILILGVCFILSIAIVVVIGHFFSMRIVQPISELGKTVDHISSEDMSQRLDSGNGRDELQKLAITINRLLDRLQLSFDTQGRFIANASHELATPLASVSSQLDVALQRDRTPDEYRKVMTSVKDDVRRLGLLVRNLLEIAKASGSAGGIETSSVRIDELLLGMPGEMKKVSQLYDVVLEFDEFPEDERQCTVYGNNALLYSALKNIIHNACKFSNNKAAVVKLSFTGKEIMIAVRDNGPGIPYNEQQMIFQPFFRGNKHDKLIHGVGLGLALAHRIVSLHKGQILLHTTPGRGSMFTIVLPARQ